MKQTAQTILCFCLSLTLLFTTGCGAAKNYSYEKTFTIFREPGTQDLIDEEGVKTSVDSITFFFTNKVEKAERNSAIIQMTKWIRERLMIDNAPVIITIKSGGHKPGIYRGTLYCGANHLRTQDFAAALVQMLVGTQVSYSLCYALGTELAAQMGYPVEDTAGAEDALTLCDASPQHLDMNYACFLPAYADEQTLLNVKGLALDFYRCLTAEELRTLFAGYTDERFRQCFNDYLLSNGKEPYYNDEMNGIRFYPCGGNMRLAWEDDYSCFYLHDGYTVKNREYDLLLGTDDLLNSGYENFCYIVTNYRAQAEEVERLMGAFETEGVESKPSVLFIRDNTYEKTMDGVYLERENEIRLYSHIAYPHEYTHHLTRNGTKEAWLQELLANYACVRPGTGDWYLAWFENICQNEDETEESAVAFREFFGKVQTNLDHPFDWNSREDVRAFFNARIINNQLTDTVTGLTQSFTLSSFPNYLTTLTDEASALQAIYRDTPVETFGKTWDELVEDWKIWISSEYAWILE